MGRKSFKTENYKKNGLGNSFRFFWRHNCANQTWMSHFDIPKYALMEKVSICRNMLKHDYVYGWMRNWDWLLFLPFFFAIFLSIPSSSGSRSSCPRSNSRLRLGHRTLLGAYMKASPAPLAFLLISRTPIMPNFHFSTSCFDYRSCQCCVGSR